MSIEATEETRINVRVRGPMAAHVQSLIGPQGMYENQSEYIRDLIRHDMAQKDQYDPVSGLMEGYKQLGDGNFREVSQDDLANRALQELEAEGYQVQE